MPQMKKSPSNRSSASAQSPKAAKRQSTGKDSNSKRSKREEITVRFYFIN